MQSAVGTPSVLPEEAQVVHYWETRDDKPVAVVLRARRKEEAKTPTKDEQCTLLAPKIQAMAETVGEWEFVWPEIGGVEVLEPLRVLSGQEAPSAPSGRISDRRSLTFQVLTLLRNVWE